MLEKIFFTRADGEFHDYVVNLTPHSKWKGIITSLRLDPANSTGIDIAVKSILGQ